MSVVRNKMVLRRSPQALNRQELLERNRALTNIALSAIALKLSIESGFPPTLDALNRDLALYRDRFGGAVEMIGKDAVRPANYSELTPEQQWEIDKRLGILDRIRISQ